MSEALHKSIDALESLTDKRWAYNAKDEGWSDVIDFIEERNNGGDDNALYRRINNINNNLKKCDNEDDTYKFNVHSNV